MESIAVLIPAYKPTDRLLEILNELAVKHHGPIVVVDDGCGSEFSSIFDEVKKNNRFRVLTNAVNLGKGAALKHGINFILTEFPSIRGIVTADADGQHATEDIIAVVKDLDNKPNAFVLGARKFGADTPLRSRFGNGVSRVLYRALLGLKLRDTQTGLRGLPVSLAQASLKIRSNRYEFETEQLTIAASLGLQISEVDIQTIYEDNNASSHFNPLFDSARIYFIVLRYAFSSIATALIDLLIFFIILPFMPNLVLANLGSRAVALIVQFLLIRNFVFHSTGGVRKFALFVCYVAFTGIISGLMQDKLIDLTGMKNFPAKIIVDMIIFVFNFLFLRDIMFNQKKSNDTLREDQ